MWQSQGIMTEGAGLSASKISNLTQRMFVGAVSDNFDERIEQKIFQAESVVDVA